MDTNLECKIQVNFLGFIEYFCCFKKNSVIPKDWKNAIYLVILGVCSILALVLEIKNKTKLFIVAALRQGPNVA